MHTKEDQELLDSMNDKEERTTKKSFMERGTFIKNYEYWYLTKNEMPYKERWDKQYILRLKETSNWCKTIKFEFINEPTWLALQEMTRIWQKLWLEWLSRNRKKECSVKRFHFHIFN